MGVQKRIYFANFYLVIWVVAGATLAFLLVAGLISAWMVRSQLRGLLEMERLAGVVAVGDLTVSTYRNAESPSDAASETRENAVT